ncbi:MAG: hypothetical protein HOW73_24135 [Polyangiaceae bacterium]|nr:hypothetical protein [Polyangiaceae bacterium]
MAAKEEQPTYMPGLSHKLIARRSNSLMLLSIGRLALRRKLGPRVGVRLRPPKREGEGDNVAVGDAEAPIASGRQYEEIVVLPRVATGEPIKN